MNYCDRHRGTCDDKCQQMNWRGVHCTRVAALIVTRVDGTEFRACVKCAEDLREQRTKSPHLFEPLRFRFIKSPRSTAHPYEGRVESAVSNQQK